MNKLQAWWKYNAMWKIRQWAENALIGLVWALPKKVVYWATIRAGSHASTGAWGHEHPMGVTLEKILTRWEMQ